MPLAGSLAVVVGADTAGAPTGRLAMVHAAGPAWYSQAGGHIDGLIRLDVRLGADEGGAVLGANGALLGLATAGPRRRAMVIPAATIAKVIDALLAGGRVERGWMGVGLQSVALAAALAAQSGQRRGAMVLQLVEDGPAARAGIQPGDILLGIDGLVFGQGRRIVSLMGPERIGQPAVVRLARGHSLHEFTVIITARPGA